MRASGLKEGLPGVGWGCRTPSPPHQPMRGPWWWGGKEFDRPPCVRSLKSPIEGIMRGRGRFLLASCLRRWDIRPSSRKDSSELRKDSSELHVLSSCFPPISFLFSSFSLFILSSINMVTPKLFHKVLLILSYSSEGSPALVQYSDIINSKFS
jgi:hypothetical protein